MLHSMRKLYHTQKGAGNWYKYFLNQCNVQYKPIICPCFIRFAKEMLDQVPKKSLIKFLCMPHGVRKAAACVLSATNKGLHGSIFMDAHYLWSGTIHTEQCVRQFLQFVTNEDLLRRQRRLLSYRQVNSSAIPSTCRDSWDSAMWTAA